MTTPYATALPGRFAASIRAESAEGCRIALLGVPDDTGVRMNGGRAGAAGGPAAFRAALCRYGVVYHAPTRSDLGVVGVFDAGDVHPASSLAATHEAVSARVSALLHQGLLPVCVGGGHDLTWPLVRAVSEHCPGLGGIYYDAHLDVRQEEGSGMAFRRILTETTCRELHVVGLDPFANAREHVEWFRTHGGFVHPDTPVAVAADDLFISFDLDVINAAEAPGVSAINPVGMTGREADVIAYESGRNPRTRCFDLMELNPSFDIDGRTARLAARLFLSFIAGFASRGTT